MAAPTTEMPPELLASLQYQQENIDDDRTGVLIGVCWFLWTLAVMAVGLRFYAERMLRTSLKLHDGLILLGLIFTTGLCVCTSLGVAFGSGRHLILASETDITNTAKLLFSFELIYSFANVAIKCSVLVFFYRTFPSRGFKMAVKCVGAFVICWLVTMLFLTVFQCTPISFVWNKNQPGQCIDVAASYLSTAAINVITDFVIVVMPLPLIWKLKLPNGRKIGICGIFFLGSIVIVASIVRPVYIKNLNTYDISYEGIDLGLWSLVEPCLGIVGACLPLMAPIFRRVKEISTAKATGGSGSSAWTHSRLKEGQTGLSQHPWRKESETSASAASATPAFVVSDNSPLTSHREWAERDSDNDLTTTAKRDLEMGDLPKAVYR